MRHKTLPFILLIFIACFVHWLPSIAFDFINFDDPGFIEENYLIYLPPSETFIQSLSTTIRGNWVPLTFTSFSIDYHLHGLYGPAYHLTNILFHSLNTVLVFLIFRFLFNDFLPLKKPNSPIVSLDFIAALSALFWAIHPLRVEAVTWVSARKRCSLHVFLSLEYSLCYLYYIHQKASSSCAAYSQTGIIFWRH